MRSTLRLALRNTLRQKARTAITVIAIMCGVAALIVSGGFVRDILTQLGEAVIHSQSGHLQVTRKGFRSAGMRSPEKYELGEPEAMMSAIAALPGVDAVMARSAFSAVLGNGRGDLAVLGEGIDAEKEKQLGTRVTLVSGRALEGRDRAGILLGKGVAEALRLAPGDRATLLASTRDGAMNTVDVEVVGVFQSFSKDFDARAVKVPLAVAQQLMDSRGANALVVALRHTPDTDAVASLLRARLAQGDVEVTTWPELNDFYEKAVTLYEKQFGILQIIILLSVLLSVVNSVNMSIAERTAEFGTMRVLGNRASTVFILVQLESLIVGLIGSVLGAALGIVLAYAISAAGIPMPPPPGSDLVYTARIELAWRAIIGAMSIGIVAAALAGSISGLRVTRIPVAAALRQGV